MSEVAPWVEGYLRGGWVYVDHGRDFERRRVDCWGLAMHILATQYGVELPSYDDEYESGLDPATVEMYEARRLDYPRVDWGSHHAGDLVVTQWGAEPVHVAVICGPLHMLQITKHGVQCPKLTSARRRRMEGIYRCLPHSSRPS